MRWKRNLITFAILLAAAAAIVLATAALDPGHAAEGTAHTMMRLSNGCFIVSVLYIGCSVLMYIQEAGNFYGIQFLFHTLVKLFSPRKRRAADRKTYYAYCLEKKEQQAAEGKSPIKPAMLLMGIMGLALSLIFMMLFYRAA